MIPAKISPKSPQDITNPASGTVAPSNGSDGTVVQGTGSTYSATLVQRVNKSIPKDEPGAVQANANPGNIPMVGVGARRTGRVLPLG